MVKFRRAVRGKLGGLVVSHVFVAGGVLKRVDELTLVEAREVIQRLCERLDERVDGEGRAGAVAER